LQVGLVIALAFTDRQGAHDPSSKVCACGARKWVPEQCLVSGHFEHKSSRIQREDRKLPFLPPQMLSEIPMEGHRTGLRLGRLGLHRRDPMALVNHAAAWDGFLV